MSSKCSVCCGHVKRNHRNLKCSLCNKYIHKRCSNLTNKEFKTKRTKFWHCASCNEKIGLPFNHFITDNDYLLELSRFFGNEKIIGDICQNKFEHLSFDPSVFQADIEDSKNKSSYYYTEKLPTQNGNSSNNFSILNVNIRSLNKKIDLFKDFVHCTQSNFGIIGLVETWLNDTPHDYFKLNGYNLEFSNRTGKRGGGVCLYIKEDVKYKIRSDLQQIKHPEYVESTFIEIDRPGFKNIVVGIVYRPPDQDVNVFNDFIDSVLTCASKNQKSIYLMGDFNINLLNEDVHLPTNNFINIMSTYSLYPTITKPTRITRKSATLIDNIFTNSRCDQTSGIIMTDLSDHFPIFVSTDLDVPKKAKVNDHVYVRQCTSQNIEIFKKELSDVNWNEECNCGNANEAYSRFINKFNTIFDKCVPLKKKTSGKRNIKPKSPWITFGLLKSIRRKDVLYKKSLRKPSDTNIAKYKQYRNKLNSLLRTAKRNYYSELLEDEKNNMRNTWKIINSIIRKKTKTSNEKFVLDNKDITCPIEIATQFNKYFANIGPKLASSIQHNGKDFSFYLNENHTASTFFFKPTDEEEICTLIAKLGNGKSAGHDDIKSDVVKQVSKEISIPLAMIFNLSLSTGIVPDDLKIAKVVPIYKKDNPELFGNYRPVSVLPCLSKILERIVHNRVYDFLCKNNILFKKQYGFRTDHSTYMAVLDFVSTITKAIDDNMYTMSIFMDLSKAFDTIDHGILLQKLYHYGFRGVSNDWFCNYLSNRKQFVVYNSTKSPTEDVSCGVPQGSILGPLLFILYMNDICNTSKILNMILFADDTTVFYSNKNLSILCSTMNTELKEISNWFKANKLSLNASKTNLMYLGTSKQTGSIKESSDHNIYLDGCKLNRVQDAKFLGITIDENLSWKKHVDSVCKTCSRNIGVLSKVKHFLPSTTMKQLYCTLVLPYLNYGLLLWGNVTNEYMNKVFKLQKRAIRTISNSPYLCPTKPLFTKYNILNIFDLYMRDVAIFMYKYKSNMLPQSFDGCFVTNKDTHTYNTRNKDNFKSYIGKIKTIFTNGPKIWNALPNELKHTKSLSLFRSKIKCHIASS